MIKASYQLEEANNSSWFGNVPESWTTTRVGQIFQQRNERVSDKDFPPLSVTKKGILPQLGHVAKTDDNENRKLVKKGDFVINSRSDRKGSAGVADRDGSVSLINTVLKIGPRLDEVFCHHLLRSYAFQEEFYRMGSGLVADLWSTNFNAMKGISLPLPPMGEQRAIATYLDRETARIDGLIEKKARFIALLKEKRVAVIAHAVTKGLNRDAPMKAGDFKAIGAVPAHWDISPVSRALMLSKSTVGKRSDEFKLLSLTTRGVIERDISENFGKFPESFNTYQQVQPGNFVFCLFDIDETPRTVGRSDLHGMITGAYAVFECIAPAYSDFLYYLFLHLDNFKGLKPFYTGLRKTIRPPRFTSIRVPFPPEDEAKRIVEHIEHETAKIDTLITKTEQSIELLREKRAALITAAVTGKIDVRSAA